jgi:hypothetical protein
MFNCHCLPVHVKNSALVKKFVNIVVVLTKIFLLNSIFMHIGQFILYIKPQLCIQKIVVFSLEVLMESKL